MLYGVTKQNIILTLVKMLESMSPLYTFCDVTFLPLLEIYMHVNET